MKETNLAIFYHLGAGLAKLKELKAEMPMNEAALLITEPARWLTICRLEMENVFTEHLQHEADDLSKLLGIVIREYLRTPLGEGTLAGGTNWAIQSGIRSFESAFDHECRQMDIFAVTPKGDLSTRVLIDDASKKFPQSLLGVMPKQTIEDLQEAGRCLAFERSTACAFHICRATEALMRAYYKKLTGVDWPPPKMNKDWKVLADQLRVKGAPKVITNRLDEIRDDRNAYAHPDITVPLDEGPIVYDLCTGVMFYMAKEMI